jgi:serine/threonine protein kinase
MSHQAERRVGAVIANKWRIDALLGSGSMAAVYSATHRNGARAALKILHPTLCADTSVCERFLGEGYLTNSVKHRGIVRVLDDGMTEDGCVFLVMDLLEGVTLETLRQDRGGQIGLPEFFDIADKLMDVLRAVHDTGIIHRDLKPQNVFICGDASVKLLDFGVARGFARAQDKLSVFGLVLGTPSFMSPEQALGSRDDVDHRSDIWSLGATLFTALTGQTVHLGPNVQARLFAAATVKARSIAMAKPDLPAPLVAAIDMALRFERKERWQTVDAFQHSVRDIRAQLGLGHAPARVGVGLDTNDEPTVPIVPESNLPKSAPPIAARTERPHGPNGTFVGIGALDAAGASAAPRDPAASAKGVTVRMRPAPSYDDILAAPVLPPASGPSPVSAPRPPVPILSPLGTFAEDEEAPLSFSKIDIGSSHAIPRRPRIGMWLGAVFLVVVAVSGVAFFAVGRVNLHSDGTTGEREPLALTAGESRTTAVAKSGLGQSRVDGKAEPPAVTPDMGGRVATLPTADGGERATNPHKAIVTLSPAGSATVSASVAPKPAPVAVRAQPPARVEGEKNNASAGPEEFGQAPATQANQAPASPAPAHASAKSNANQGKAETPSSSTTLAPDPFSTPD